ncbi:hypothetical protein [uncultured Roseobacter sp.]|uniref:hypothetical protein n=1 Tax=uncultured Roseobacter sp. TaxID=114847 RepID=UPI00260D1E18|nr:hypothetical protein [uncultured Roseobacter sp.]
MDDEEEAQRKLPERLLHDAFPKFFPIDEISEASFTAEDGGFGTVSILWTHAAKKYEIKYFKCLTADEIKAVQVSEYEVVVFIFDVHRDNDNGQGAGTFLEQSVRAAEELVGTNELRAVIWTHFPTSDAAKKSRYDAVRKQDTSAFAMRIMEMLGFETSG